MRYYKSRLVLQFLLLAGGDFKGDPSQTAKTICEIYSAKQVSLFLLNTPQYLIKWQKSK